MLLKIALSLAVVVGLAGFGILVLYLWLNSATDDWGDWSNGRW